VEEKNKHIKNIGAYLVCDIEIFFYVVVAKIFATPLYAFSLTLYCTVDIQQFFFSILSHHNKAGESLKHTLASMLFLGYHRSNLLLRLGE
jgi:hypothetical protein